MDVTFDGYRVRGLTMAQKEDFARDKLRKIEQLLGYGEKNIYFWNDNYEKIEKEIQTLRNDITQIRTDNNEILRIVGRLEGKLESK